MRRALLFVVLATSGLAAQTQSPPPPMSGQIPPQLLEFESRINKVALELASEPIAPISLDADGSRRHGVLYDRIMLGSLIAKRMIAEGKTPSAEVTVPGSGLAPNAYVIVAYPMKCGERLRAPADIVFIAASGRGGPSAVREVVPSPSLEAAMAALEKPAQAMASAFLAASLSNARVEITYEGDACPGQTDPVSLPITLTPPRSVRMVGVAALPPEATALPSPTVVRIQFYADQSGRVRAASLATGPAELLPAAVAHASQWQFEPARANGTPIAQSMTVQVSFTATGAPAPRPPAPPPGPGDVAMSSNGPLGSGTTASVPGLTRANSACAVSDDPNFGTTPQQPIKVGGGMRVGPARERQYLLALRGPEGQGLTFRRVGSLQGPEGTILDRYAVTYAGAEKTISLFLDEYRWDDLKAPSGLVCSQPFGLPPPDAGPSAAPAGAVPAPTDTPTLPETTTRDIPNLTAATSQCPVAAADNYGVTPDRPIGIGGGLEIEQKFMDLLRGPEGQGTRYKKVGTRLAADSQTLLSTWQVTYAGLASPLTIFFDRAKSEDPQAPKGWTCSAKFVR